jgi:uncharacterized repeat protein (TIGR01451 family)
MQKALVFALVFGCLCSTAGKASADGFVATLSGTLIDDVDEDGFGAGDTVEFNLPVAHTGTTMHGSLQVVFDVPAESTISAIRGYTSFDSSIFVDMGNNPGDDRVILNFAPAPYASSETAVVLFRLTVTDRTTLSMTGRLAFADENFNEVYEYTNTVVFTEGMRNVVETVTELEGALGAALLFDDGYYGTLETGESLTYSAIITNTGDALSNIIVRGVLDHNTLLIPGSVTVSRGEVVFGNEEGDETVEVILSNFAAGATAAIAYAVTVPAQVTDGTRRITGKVTVVEAASEKPLLELLHDTTLGPLVRLVAVFENDWWLLGVSAEDPIYKETIVIRNDGPVAVTGVTVIIKGLAEPPTREYYNTIQMPLRACTDFFPHHCSEDGTDYCEGSGLQCVAAPGVEQYTHEGVLDVGESFEISWKETIVNPDSWMYRYVRYQVEITATQLAEPGETFTVAQKLERVLEINTEETALSLWVALAAALAALAYAYRKRSDQHAA